MIQRPAEECLDHPGSLFESFQEGALHPEPFTQELCLYRFPPRPDGELHAMFPVTPSRGFTAEELLEGRVHVEIRTSPLLLRGALVGGEGQVVQGEGDAELLVPPGALTDTISAFVDALDETEVDFYDVAPDGRFLMIRAEESSEPAQINVVLNWFGELERLVPTN